MTVHTDFSSSIMTVTLPTLDSPNPTDGSPVPTGPSFSDRERALSYDEISLEHQGQKTCLDPKEERFIAERKVEIISGLTSWKASYNPAPPIFLSFVPKISNVIKKASLLAVATCMDRLERALTRRKIVSILEDGKKTFEENNSLMNSSTQKKVREAVDFINGELKRLRDFGPLQDKAAAVPKSEKEPKLDDPIYSEKSTLLTRCRNWKKDFSPAPIWILSRIPGMETRVLATTDRLFCDLCSDIRRVKSMDALKKKLQLHSDLIQDYTTFVDASTTEKMRALCDLLTAPPA